MKKNYFLMFVFLFTCVSTYTADRTIADGGGDWSNPATWVENAVPTDADEVIATATSGNLTIDANAVCRSINLTNYTGTLTHNASVSLTIGDATAGTGDIALKFVLGMNYVLGSEITSSIVFVSSSATVQTIDYAGKITGNVTFDNATGSWQMVSDHSMSQTITDMAEVPNGPKLDLISGTIDTNGYTMNWGCLRGGGADGGGTGTKALKLGSSIINIFGGGGENATAPHHVKIYGANLTVHPNTASLKTHRSVKVENLFHTASNQDWNGLSLEFHGGGLCTLWTSGGVSSYKSITYYATNSVGTVVATRGNGLNLLSGGMSVDSSLNLFGLPDDRLHLFRKDEGTTQMPITLIAPAVVNAAYLDVGNVNAINPIDLSGVEGGSGNFGNNTNITFTSGIDLYWHSASGGTKDWSDKSNWFLNTNGVGPAPRAPIAQDSVFFDVNSFGAVNTIVNVESTFLCRDMTWSGVTNSPTLHFPYTKLRFWNAPARRSYIYGNMTLDANMSLTTSASDAWLYFKGHGTANDFEISLAGHKLPFFVSIVQFLSSTNSLKLLDKFSSNHFIANIGTFNANNQDLEVESFYATGSPTVNMGSGTWAITGKRYYNSATDGRVWFINGGTINTNTSTIKLTNGEYSHKIFAGGGRTYNILTLSGTGSSSYEIQGANTFHTLNSDKTEKYSLKFVAGTTNTFTNFDVSGSPNKINTIGSMTNVAHTLTLSATGTINADHVHISYSTITGVGNWLAGANSIDGGNNSVAPGWVFATTDTDFTWTGASNSNWSDIGNWVGGVVPGPSDLAIFIGKHNIACTIDAPIDVKGIRIGQNYTQTITQANTMLLGVEGLYMDNGTFVGATQNIASNGSVLLNAGTFTSTFGNFEILAQNGATLIVNSSTFNHNNGTITITGTNSCQIEAPSNKSLHHLVFNSSGTASGTIYVAGDLTRSAGSVWDADVYLSGNYLGSSSSTAGTGTIRFVGTVAQNFTNQFAPNVQINKSTGVLDIPANIQVGGSWNHQAGALNWNNNKITFDGTSDITITKGGFYEVEIDKNATSKVQLTNTCTIADNLMITSLAELNGANLELSGNLIVTPSVWTGTSKLIFKGTNDQNFDVVGKMGVSVDINKPSGKVTLLNNLDIYNTGHDLRILDGELVLDGKNLTVNDEFSIFDSFSLRGSETITVSGTTSNADSNAKFTISGTSSTITYTDSGVTAVVTNLGKTFYSLVLGAGKTHEFATGTSNRLTINGTFASNGSSGSRSVLRSLGNVATDWELTLSGTSTLADKVSVKRSNASFGLGVLATGSLNGGNNTKWIGLLPLPVINSITSSTANGIYGTGATIAVTIAFNKSITLTGNMTINLDSGGSVTISAFTGSSASGTYTVGAGHSTTKLTATSVTVSGTAQDGSSQNLVTILPTTNIATGSSIEIDTVAPTIASVSALHNNSYIDITFSEAIYATNSGSGGLVANDFTLVFAANSGTATGVTIASVKTTTDSATAGGETTVRVYLTVSGEASGVETITISPATNSIFDKAGNPALTTTTTGAITLLNAIVPVITDVTSPAIDKKYATGNITIQVVFNEVVMVAGGNPTLTLETGSIDRQATYSSGSGSSILNFIYTIQSGDVSSDLDYTSTTALALAGATIKSQTGVDAILTLPEPGATNSLGANKAIQIDAITPTMLSATIAPDSSYVDITMSESVFTTATGGALVASDFTLVLASNGGLATSATIASISSITGTTLIGGENVVRLHLSINPTISGVETITINVNANSIFDGAGNVMSGSQTSGALLLQAGVAPTITNVTSSNNNGLYFDGDQISIQIQFSEAVTVSGTPSLLLNVGENDRKAFYSSGSGTNTLTFIFDIAIGDDTNDLNYENASSLSSGLNLIKGSTNIAADLALPAPSSNNSLGGNKAIVINTDAPKVVGISTTKANGTYGVGEIIPIEVKLNKTVTLSGGVLIAKLNNGVEIEIKEQKNSEITILYVVGVNEEVERLDVLSLELSSGASIVDGSGRSLDISFPENSFATLFDIEIKEKTDAPGKKSSGGCHYSPDSNPEDAMQYLVLLFALITMIKLSKARRNV